MNKYAIRIDKNNIIVRLAYTFDMQDEDIEISYEEYIEAQKHRTFNPISREFGEEIVDDADTNIITEGERIEQLEETVGLLAEQVAKQTLDA